MTLDLWANYIIDELLFGICAIPIMHFNNTLFFLWINWQLVIYCFCPGEAKKEDFWFSCFLNEIWRVVVTARGQWLRCISRLSTDTSLALLWCGNVLTLSISGLPCLLIFPQVTVEMKWSRAATDPWPVTASDTSMVLLRSTCRTNFFLWLWFEDHGTGGTVTAGSPVPHTGSGTPLLFVPSCSSAWRPLFSPNSAMSVIQLRKGVGLKMCQLKPAVWAVPLPDSWIFTGSSSFNRPSSSRASQ